MIRAVLAVVFIMGATLSAVTIVPTPAPEIDAATAVGAVGVLVTGLFMIRARSKRN